MISSSSPCFSLCSSFLCLCMPVLPGAARSASVCSGAPKARTIFKLASALSGSLVRL
jgi:hypothetical protein